MVAVTVTFTSCAEEAPRREANRDRHELFERT